MSSQPYRKSRFEIGDDVNNYIKKIYIGGEGALVAPSLPQTIASQKQKQVCVTLQKKHKMSFLRTLRPSSLSHIRNTTPIFRRTIQTTSRTMVTNTQQSEASKVISDVSKQEGGTHKGSISSPSQIHHQYHETSSKLTPLLQAPHPPNCNPKQPNNATSKPPPPPSTKNSTPTPPPSQNPTPKPSTAAKPAHQANVNHPKTPSHRPLNPSPLPMSAAIRFKLPPSPAVM